MNKRLEYNHFQTEINRLKAVYGDRMYPTERCRHLYQLAKHLQNASFTDVVTEAIATYRGAPLAKELNTLIDRHESMAKDRAIQSQVSVGDIADVLEKAYEPANYDDPEQKERIKLRLRLVRDFTIGKLTRKQFEDGCNLVDGATPDPDVVKLVGPINWPCVR